MNLMQQIQHAVDMAALEQAIEDAVVERVDEGLALWTVTLQGKHIGSIKHERTDAGGRYTDKLIWQYQFADKNYWGWAPSKKSAVNSIVHRALFA